MVNSAHLSLVFLEQSQAQKDVTLNEALARIDAILNTGAIDRDLATPPASPAAGDVYVVAGAATGDWAGQEDDIAYFDGGIWRFITPNTGMSLWVSDEGAVAHFTGSQWELETERTRGHGRAQYHRLKSLSDAASISWDVQQFPMAEVTLGGNRSLENPANAAAGGDYQLIVRQDATGGRTLSFGSDYAFAGGVAPSLSSAANAVDLLRFTCDGSKMLGQAVLNLQ